jgi:hypothetical protein
MSELDKDIREEYAKHNSLFKTARKFGVAVEYINDIVRSQKIEQVPDTSTCAFEGFGDPEKKKYLVARNLANQSWDNNRPEVASARSKYEAGTHDMATGRDGPWLLLYLFPRAVPKPRPNYFTPTVEG